MRLEEQVYSVTDFVAVLNQTLEYAYPSVIIEGELANFRTSQNKWVYFDLKDDMSSVRFFGTTQQLPGPLEDGMLIRVRGVPRLHHKYNFSVNVQFMQPVGEGSIKKASALLEAKLKKEGLFDADRKRTLPYPPQSVGLITSEKSAAYGDFLKILNQRWSGIEIKFYDVQVQGDSAVEQIVGAIDYFNTHDHGTEILILTRGGGGADDMAAFSTEQITRAIAGSRVPTLVAIGHEMDLCLAEMAADVRASTPSNAAEILAPDKKLVGSKLIETKKQLGRDFKALLESRRSSLREVRLALENSIDSVLKNFRQRLDLKTSTLSALSPSEALKRGYAIIKLGVRTIRSINDVSRGDKLDLTVSDGKIKAEVQ